MSNSKIFRGAGRIISAASAVIAMFGCVSVSAADAAVPHTMAEHCGYLEWGQYRHCDGGTGSTVMLDVQDVWGNIYHYCVGPGVTDLQPVIRWRVTGAWWNGGVGCAPGYYGPA
ncbi:DUF6355 family natural product biosynthesis protein [Amycolatopsis mediterranei]|uniref:DUF6355 family natural product biosynthesis protein n=2 Tax=Amycolatopsis mediterranei TaxID=33910 RepID=UPI000B33BA10|nr:DUF6355 family natural product biosynthesis protein [Amycolatopsis mediterranei]